MTTDPAHHAFVVPDSALCRVHVDNARLTLRLTNDDASLGVAQPVLNRFLASFGASTRAIYQTELVFEELVTNIIRYAYANQATWSRPIDVTIQLSAMTIDVEIEDEGPAFDPVQAPDRPLPASVDDAQIGGLGLRFVRAATIRFSYERAGNRNRVTALIARD